MSDIPGQAWTGFYHDGLTAGRQPVLVTLSVAGLELRFADDGGTATWPFGDVRQTQGRMPGEPLRLEYGNPVQALVVDEPGLAEAIRRIAPDPHRSVRPPWSTARILGWSFGLIAATVIAYVAGAPIAAEYVAARIPLSWEQELGSGVAGRLASDRVCHDSSAVADLRLVLDRLLAAGAPSPYEWTLTVVRDTTVNAFAAPGGFITVHTGLLAAAKTPEEFAGVLAHEIQHIARRHSTRAIVREIPVRLAIASITGNTGLESALLVATSLGALRYRRADETEADREGMRLLHAARVDPTGMVAFMRSLDKDGTAPPRFIRYLGSHPRTAERVEELERLAQTGSEARPILDAARWQRVRAMCASE